MGIKERILLFIEAEGITKAEFERRSQLSNGYINNIKGSVGTEKIENILKAFPDLNREWLMSGTGQMKKSIQNIIQQGDNNINNSGIIKNSTIDNRSYYSDSPDVLRAEIDKLDRIISEKEERIKEKDAQIKEKDAQIKEKDAQIKEKDAQIKTLLEILKK